MKNVVVALTMMLLGLTASVGNSAEIEVKMLNKGSDGQKLVSEPAMVLANVGDTIVFLPPSS